MVDVFVGVGSNLEPEAHLARAIEQLGRELGPLRCSQLYESPPFGFEGPDFLNAVLAFESDEVPAAIEAVLTTVESVEGRPKAGERTLSRTLDLDLLLYGARVEMPRPRGRTDRGYQPTLRPPSTAMIWPVT